MNRTLLTFAVLLILLGLGFGFYVVSLFGLLLLFPALMGGSRPPIRVPPQPQKQEPRRVSPPPIPQSYVSVPQSMPVATPQPQPPMQSAAYSQPLFPMAMFPALATMSGPPSAPVGSHEKSGERDELVEIGAILALLKLALG